MPLIELLVVVIEVKGREQKCGCGVGGALQRARRQRQRAFVSLFLPTAKLDSYFLFTERCHQGQANNQRL
jgi:hypothetical protein